MDVTFTSTFRTSPSSLWKAFVILPMDHSCRLACLSFSRTMSPSLRFGLFVCHFCLLFCLLRLASEKFPGGRGGVPIFCVSSIDGVSISGASGSEETGISGRELIIAVTSAINVHRTSWVTFNLPAWSNIESRIRRAIPIMRSQLPPMLDACGGLNAHVHFWLRR